MEISSVMTRTEADQFRESLKEEIIHLVDIRLNQGQPSEARQWDIMERSVRVEEELKAQRELMEKQFELVDKRFEQVDKQLEAQRELMEKQFEQVEKRFEQVERRFEQVDKQLEAQREMMLMHFEQIDKRFEQTDKRIDDLREDMNRRFNTFTLILLLGIPVMTTALGSLGYFVLGG